MILSGLRRAGHAREGLSPLRPPTGRRALQPAAATSLAQRVAHSFNYAGLHLHDVLSHA